MIIIQIKFENPFIDKVEKFNDMIEVKAYLTNGTVKSYILGEELVIDNPDVKKFEVLTESRGIVTLDNKWMPISD